MRTIEIQPLKNTIEDWRAIYQEQAIVEIGPEARTNIENSCVAMARMLSTGAPVYGVNTGFGKMSSIRIEDHQITKLQSNLVLSHTVGVGEPLDERIVRLAMAMKIAAISGGASAVRTEVVDALVLMLNRGVIPFVPSQGSVGASGDLAPLAHISAVLIGNGKAWFKGELLPGATAMERAGIKPIVLGAKEGLALLNGTQVSTSLALGALFDIERLFKTAIVVGALTTEATLGSLVPFDPRIHALRPHHGQRDVAHAFRKLLDGGQFRERQKTEGRLQDPYSLRCQPQVMGACLDLIRFACSTLEVEARSVSDNPLVFADTGEVLSGGNFHAEPVAFAADILAMTLCEIGGLSERRIAFMIDSSMSGLPPFLTTDAGLSSGFMSLQIASAALVAENRQKSHPASVDSVPTVGNQEDYVSMATHGARRLFEMVRNVESILSTELLAAVQGMDHRSLDSNRILEEIKALVRDKVPSMAADWEFSSAVEAGLALVRSRKLVDTAGKTLIQLAVF